MVLHEVNLTSEEEVSPLGAWQILIKFHAIAGTCPLNDICPNLEIGQCPGTPIDCNTTLAYVGLGTPGLDWKKVQPTMNGDIRE